MDAQPPFPRWAPSDLIDWLERMQGKIPRATLDLFTLLLTDGRMRPVWEWHTVAKVGATHDVFGTAHSFCEDIKKSLRLPGKPGSLTKAQRKKYFDQVKQHANALIGLLEGTYFSSSPAIDAGIRTDWVDDDKLAETVARDLRPYGDDDPGHVVAYYVNSDGVSRLPWNYPDGNLLDQLSSVLEWTDYEDDWDMTFSPTRMRIDGHANTNRTRIVFFVVNLHDALSGQGIFIPHAHLATVTNVALCLEDDEQVDEELVRKQIRRHQAKQEKTIRKQS